MTALIVCAAIAAVAGVVALFVIAVRALNRAEQKRRQIVREEVDAHRPPYDPSDFAMDLRIDPDIDTRLPGDDR